MCTHQNLNIVSSTLLVIRFVIGLYLLIAGALLVANVHLAQAFGSGPKIIGACTIVVGVLGTFAAAVNKFGSLSHNKFCLLYYICCDCALLAAQLALGATLYGYTLPDYDTTFQLDCLRSVPEVYSDAECEEFLRSDRFAGMLLVWRSYTFLSLETTSYYSLASNIETDGACCGFGPPLRCEEDLRPFPSYLSTKEVGWDADARYTCSDVAELWYPSYYYCTQATDSSALTTVTGGCRYDQPMSNCADSTVAATTKGCAHAVEAHVTQQIEGTAKALLGLSVVLALGLGGACCLFWKRSWRDPMPDFAATPPRERDAEVAAAAAAAAREARKLNGAPDTRKRRSKGGVRAPGQDEELSLVAAGRVHPL